MTQEKIVKTVEVNSYIEVSTWDDMTLSALAKWASELEAKLLAEGYSNLHLSLEGAWDGPGHFVLYGDRLETDAEHAARLRKNAQARERKRVMELNKERQERALLEKLKKKYEDG